jgi:hypothetical protein
MGWIVGWTSLETIPMEKFHDWIRKNQITQKGTILNSTEGETVQMRETCDGQASSVPRKADGSHPSLQGVSQPDSQTGSNGVGEPRVAGTMEKPFEAENLYGLRKHIHIQTIQGNNMQSVVRREVGLVKQIAGVEIESQGERGVICEDALGLWAVEPPDIPRVAIGIKDRVSRLKAIGNGQVPQCAAAAWRMLTGFE